MYGPKSSRQALPCARAALKRLDRAFAAFYGRVKRGETPGFPRFKAASRFNSLQRGYTKGWKVKAEARRYYLFGIGDAKVNYHRPLQGTPKTITVRREGTKWWLSVRCVDVPTMPLAPTGRVVGIDVEIANLVATSDGDLIVGEHFGAQARSQLAEAQQSLATKQRGANRRRRQVEVVARLHRQVANQRKNAAHQLSRRLVNDYDPDIPGTFLANGARAKAGLNRSIHDAGWRQAESLLSYKAESAGRIVVTVNPRHTSQTRAECGHVEAGNRVGQAVFRCLSCEHVAHADVNAARNILRGR